MTTHIQQDTALRKSLLITLPGHLYATSTSDHNSCLGVCNSSLILEMKTNLLNSRRWTNLYKMVEPALEARSTFYSAHPNPQIPQRNIVFSSTYWSSLENGGFQIPWIPIWEHQFAVVIYRLSLNSWVAPHIKRAISNSWSIPNSRPHGRAETRAAWAVALKWAWNEHTNGFFRSQSAGRLSGSPKLRNWEVLGRRQILGVQEMSLP